MSRPRLLLAGILALALLVRLYHVTFPVGGFAAWRQADTAAMAKNFYYNGFRILQPQIDWGGNSAGNVETEFPLYSFLVAALYKIFFRADMWGRILSIGFALASVTGLYLLVNRILGKQTALWSALVYAILPVNVFYTRAVMPESMMLMCSIFGVLFFLAWAEAAGRPGKIPPLFFLLLSALFIALAALLKITALSLGVPILFLAWTRYRWALLKSPVLWGYLLLVLLPVGLWYAHAHSTFLASGLSFGIWDYGRGKWGDFSPLLSLKFYNDVFFKSIAERHLTYPGFFLFLLGLFLPRSNPRERLFDWWLAGMLLFFAIVTRGNQIHEYYQLPFTIPAAVFIAKALNACCSPAPFLRTVRTAGGRTALRAGVLLCAMLIPVLAFLRYKHYMEGERLDGSVFRLGSAVQQETAQDALVVAVDEGDPVVLYRCDRRGWHASADGISADSLQRASSRGARYLVGTTDFFDTPGREETLRALFARFPAVRREEDYFILRLGP